MASMLENDSSSYLQQHICMYSDDHSLSLYLDKSTTGLDHTQYIITSVRVVRELYVSYETSRDTSVTGRHLDVRCTCS